MLHDEKLKNICREHEFKRIIEYNNFFQGLKVYVENDMKSAKSYEDVKRIEGYLKWVEDWMANDLCTSLNYLILKGVMMGIVEHGTSNIFADIEKLQKDIKKRSDFYAAENGE